jgi:hypothetical protein
MPLRFTVFSPTVSQTDSFRPEVRRGCAFKLLSSWLDFAQESQLTSLELFNPNQEIPEQAFTKSGHFVPEPAPHFATAVMDINAPLFGDCPCHNPTPDAKDPPLGRASQLPNCKLPVVVDEVHMCHR